MTNTARLHSWSDVPKEQLNPLLQRQFISGRQATISQFHLQKGCIVPTHSHPSEQLVSVMSGTLRFTLDPDGTPEHITVRPGELLVIPGNLSHSAEALEDTFNFDIFAPVREDWESGTDAYLR